MQLVTEKQVMSEATPTESGVEPLPGFWSVAHIFSIIGTFNFWLLQLQTDFSEMYSYVLIRLPAIYRH